MHERDDEFARRVSEVVRHFPDIWQGYQDWLREIVASRSVLLDRYPAWQASFVFRWRLLYFVVYVAGVMLFAHLGKGLKRVVAAINGLRAKLSPARDAIARPVPISVRYRYILQRTATLLAVAELTLCGIAALTGILLAFYYQPAAMGAYESLHAIAQGIPNGMLVFSLHHVAGHSLIALALVQLVVMFLGRELLPVWFVGWLSGILLTLTAIGLSWTAVILSWEQTSFWRFKLELNIVGSIPLVGSALREILSGGGDISTVTLQHMYALHGNVLAIAAILFSVLHLAALLLQEQRWKPVETRFNLAKLCNNAAANGDSPSA